VRVALLFPSAASAAFTAGRNFSRAGRAGGVSPVCTSAARKMGIPARERGSDPKGVLEKGPEGGLLMREGS